MKTYEVKMMIQKAGKEPARLGLLDVEAASEQEALDIATAEGIDHYNLVCEDLGRHPDETTQIWAELAEED